MLLEVFPLTLPLTSTSELSAEFAKERTLNVTGERMIVDAVANPHIPPIKLSSISVTVTGYKSLEEFAEEMEAKGLICKSVAGLEHEVSMVFVEVDSSEVGKSHGPRFISKFKDAGPIVKPWDLDNTKLDPQLVETFVVHIGARQPGVYTYRAEAVFRNRLGDYSPIVLQEGRTVMFDRELGERELGPTEHDFDNGEDTPPPAPPAPEA